MVWVSFFISILFFLVPTAFAKITVYGKVTGFDGKPMICACIFLTYPSDDNPVKSIMVEKDGNYKIDIGSVGLWVLHFTGTFHHEYPIAIYSKESKKIRLDVKLRTYNYNTNFSSAKIIGNFNEWSPSNAVELKKADDSTYSATVDNNSDTLLYRLINVRTGGKVEGTDADGYFPNGPDPEGIEGYNSFLVKKKEMVKIIFDPRKLSHSNQASSFEFTPANSFESRFAQAYATLEDIRQKFNTLLYAHISEYHWGFKFDFTLLIDSVKNLMDNETNELIHQVYRLGYFGIKYLSTTGHYVDNKTSRETLNDIPPNSVVWALKPEFIFKAMKSAGYSMPERYNYIHKVIDENPMERPKAIILRDEIESKFHSLQYNDILPFLSILLDQYGNSPEAIRDRMVYARYIKLKDETQAPKFSVKAISDSNRNFTNNSFKGKYYLLNFWTVSNPASQNEIANLNNIYSKYNGKDFAILNVSLDSSSEDVAKFINNKIEMPWPQAIEEKGLVSQFCKSFEVYSVPKAILIDPNGDIKASGWNLRGSNLTKTLKKYLEK
jgi:peroxiredoxin